MTEKHTPIRLLLACTLLVAAAAPLSAQLAPDSLWAKTHGGADNDRANAMVLMPDGGFALAGDYGIVNQFGTLSGGDLWVVRTDANGDTLWTRTFAGPGIDEGNSISRTDDGGFIVAGARSSNLGIYDAWLIRLSASGDTLWTRVIGERFGEEWAEDVKQTADGGYVMAGTASSQITLSKDVWLVRTDSVGAVQWAGMYGGTADDYGFSVAEAPDGGFVVTGRTRDRGADADVFLIRTEPDGTQRWSKRFNGNDGPGSEDWGRKVIITQDAGTIVLGHAGVNAWLFSTDADGNLGWSSEFYTAPNWLERTADGGFLVSGSPRIVRTDATGNVRWMKPLNGQFYAGVQTADGGFMVAGGTIADQNQPDTDLLLVRLDRDAVSADAEAGNLPSRFLLDQNYPNPFNPSTTISFTLEEAENVRLEVIDVMGRVVRTLATGTRAAGTHSVQWDGRGEGGRSLGSGTYFYRLTAGRQSHTGQMVLLK